MPEGQYPDNWKDISKKIRERSGGQCECTGQCALHRGNRCTETDNVEAQYAEGKVVLTVAHLNHCKSDCRDENLLAMCNTCHLRYDLNLHARNAFENKRNQVPICVYKRTTVEGCISRIEQLESRVQELEAITNDQ